MSYFNYHNYHRKRERERERKREKGDSEGQKWRETERERVREACFPKFAPAPSCLLNHAFTPDQERPANKAPTPQKDARKQGEKDVTRALACWHVTQQKKRLASIARMLKARSWR